MFTPAFVCDNFIVLSQKTKTARCSTSAGRYGLCPWSFLSEEIMERTLITGGAGFLGSHLCDFFVNLGCEVICMDNLIKKENIANIAHLMGHPRFKFVKYDVTEYLYVEGKVDYILHFASLASPKDYLDYPIQTLKVGSLGTHKVLGLAKEKKARFLLASTSEVYGDPLEHPQPESYPGNVDTIAPRGVYDEAKRFAEAITMAYQRTHGVSTRIARIFNTYGPRMRPDDGRALPNFMVQALRGEDITVYGTGSQTRSFCYVEDMIAGLQRLLFSDETEPVNLGNPEEISILDFAKEILQLTGSKSNIVYCSLPQNDPKVRQPDISKAKKVLGWEPRVRRQDGLKRTLDYFRKKLFS
jgi:dTDP-glucose 4,6-dehydratase